MECQVVEDFPLALQADFLIEAMPVILELSASNGTHVLDEDPNGDARKNEEAYCKGIITDILCHNLSIGGAKREHVVDVA